MDALSDPARNVGWREWTAVGAGCLCFTLLSVFYGSYVNIIVFLGAVFALLVGTSVVARSAAGKLRASPVASGMMVVAVIALILSYQFSLSKDSSFVPAWVLALAPLAFLLSRGLGARAAWMHGAISAVVVSFAALSCAMLIVSGERASLPLADPNNYATLLYLVLIPLLHRYLVLCSSDAAPGMPLRVGTQAAVLLLAVALFATQSRTGQVIILGAFALWVVLVLQRRLSWRPLALSAVVVLAAYGVARLAAPEAVDSAATGVGAGFEIRLALVRSALVMWLDHPITGIGIYVFPLLYRHLRETVDQETAGLFVHNDYVQLLTEGGPLLLAVLLAFAGSVIVAFARDVVGREKKDLQRLGYLTALGAALAHALVNFVLFSPAVGFLLGVTAAMAFPATSAAGSPTAAELRPARLGIGTALVFGWVCWLYLGLDTATAGVLQNQRYVPFAGKVREDPQAMLRFARTAQALNGHRGVPVLAEAALLDQRLRQDPQSDALREQTLDAFRRAGRVDPWNPLTHFLMVGFITRNPSVAPALTEEETPERLLLKAVAIDPLYVPGLDALMDKLTSEGRHAEAYGLLRQRVYPWIRFLARQDSAAADRYLQFLLAVARARGEAGFARELESILPEVQATRELVKDRWWFSAVSAGDGRLADPSFGTRCSPVSPGIAWTGPAARSFS